MGSHGFPLPGLPCRLAAMDEETRASHLRVLRDLVGDIRAFAAEAGVVESEADEEAFNSKYAAFDATAKSLTGVVVVADAVIDLLEDNGRD